VSAHGEIRISVPCNRQTEEEAGGSERRREREVGEEAREKVGVGGEEVAATSA
jgi:hypothetical protein